MAGVQACPASHSRTSLKMRPYRGPARRDYVDCWSWAAQCFVMNQDALPEVRQALIEVGRCARAFRWFLALASIAIVAWVGSTIWYMGYAFQTQDSVMSSLKEAREGLVGARERQSGRGDPEAGVEDTKNTPAAEQYLRVYFLIQKADAAAKDGNFAGARTSYEEALGHLKDVEEKYPAWRQDLVRFRKRYLTEKIKSITAPGSQPAKGQTDPLPK